MATRKAKTEATTIATNNNSNMTKMVDNKANSAMSDTDTTTRIVKNAPVLAENSENAENKAFQTAKNANFSESDSNDSENEGNIETLFDKFHETMKNSAKTAPTANVSDDYMVKKPVPAKNADNKPIFQSEKAEYYKKQAKVFGKKLVEGAKDAFYSAKRGSREAYYKALYCAQRMRYSYDNTQIIELGDSELKILAKKLHKFAATAHGYPYRYDEHEQGKEAYLVKHNEIWEKSIFVPERASQLFWESPDGIKFKKEQPDTMPTIKDCGTAFCAWLEDIEFAAYVLEEYSQWNNDRKYKVSELYGDDEFDRQNKLIEERFQQVWVWIGQNINDLWD